MSRVEELKELLKKYDTAYRSGSEMVTDATYDSLVEELIELIGEDDAFFNSSIKEDFPSDRREKLPIIMASMNKVKTVEEIKTWFRLKKIPVDSELIGSPKYDGLAACKEENSLKGFTRGSNIGGLRIDEHLKYMNDIKIDTPYTYGECIISRNNYEKIAQNFSGSSPRNAVAGIFNRKEATEDLSAVDFIRYGVVGKEFKTKRAMFDFLNETQKVKVPYKILKLSDLTEESLKEIYKEFSKDYEIDGLILEVNDMVLWNELGRGRNSNPNGSIAYKSGFEQIGETRVIDIEWSISKDSRLIPVAVLEPITLDNAIIKRVTLNNASFMKSMQIGIGSTAKVIRSGGVIPLITEVLTKMPFTMPDIDCEWDENHVHLRTISETDDQRKKKLFAFFNIIGVENVSDKTFDLLFDSGYKTVKDVLSMSKEDFLTLDRFGDKKAANVYHDIQSKTKNIPLAKLQHATGIFQGLGSKKLALTEYFETKPALEEVVKIDGFSDISANMYISGFDKFFEFIKDLPITWTRTKQVEVVSNDLDGKQFVFTGFRDKAIEEIIKSRNGSIGSGISLKSNFLVMNEKGSGSAKEAKALELGVTVLDKDELIEMLGL